MTFKEVFNRTDKLLKDNSPAIFTGLGLVGVASTAYLSARAGYKSALLNINQPAFGESVDKKTKVKHTIKIHWKFYVPASISGLATMSFIVASTKASSKKAAVITAAYSLSEKAFSEYKDKVLETLGEKKEQAIRDEIAADRIKNNPPPAPSSELTLVGPRNVLCCEMYTGRYFYSDMETLRKAENEINSRILREMYAVLSDFYCWVGLPYTSMSDDIGWDTDRMLALKFTTIMTDDGRPCLAFDYNYTKPLRG